MANSDESDFHNGILNERLRILSSIVEARTTQYKVALFFMYFVQLVGQNPYTDDDTEEMTLEKKRARRAMQVLDDLMLELEQMEFEAEPVKIAKEEIIH